MIKFLEIFYDLTESQDTKNLLDIAHQAINCDDNNNSFAQEWNDHFKNITQSKDHKTYLELIKK